MKLHDPQPRHHILLQCCLPEVGMSARALHERVRVTKRVNVVDGSPVEPEIRLCGLHGMRRSGQYAGNNNQKASPQHFLWEFVFGHRAGLPCAWSCSSAFYAEGVFPWPDRSA